jgi:uncharacterized protein (DUF1330 family)
MASIIPTVEQFQDFSAADDGGPFVMLNLLRFKEVADGVNEGEGISGAEAYGRYAVGTQPHLERVGGRLLNAVAAQQTLVGPSDKEWDLVLLVEYPSRAKFVEMATDPEYLEVHKHRDSALEDSRIVACAPVQLA